MKEDIISYQLENGELIEWVGKPNLKAAKIRSIEWSILDYIKLAFLLVGFFITYYVVLCPVNERFFPEIDVYTIIYSLILFFVFKAYHLYKRINSLPYLKYYLTNRKIIMETKNNEIKIIEFSKIKKVKIRSSVTDRENRVLTIKISLKDNLNSEDNKDVYLESIDAGNTVIEKIIRNIT